MIKFIGAAIWGVLVAIAAVVFSFGSGSDAPAPVEEPAALLGGLDYVKTDIVSVPVLRNKEISGYFLGRFVYTVEPEKLAKLSVPPQTLIVDEVYSYLFGNPQVDFSNVESLDLDTFRDGIRDALNKRIGEEVIHEVLIEQLDFLTKAEIRDNTLRRRVRGGDGGGVSLGGGASEASAAAGGGHGAPAEPSGH
jgi:hypothetical protein